MKKIRLILFTLFIGLLVEVNVSAASYEFSCEYYSSEYIEFGTIKLTFRTNGDDIKMLQCTTIPHGSDTEKDCSKLGFDADGNYSPNSNYNWKFDANGNYSKNSNSCPSSIDLVGNDKIVWIKESKGMLKYTGIRTDSKLMGDSSCKNYYREKTCNDAPEGCKWAGESCLTLEDYYDLGRMDKVSCGTGKGKVTGIPAKIPELTRMIVTIIQIAVPVILVIMGSIDLFKGITAGKDDEIKKGQQMFIKRLVVAAIIFFIVVIIKFFISAVADTNATDIVNCVDCFVSDKKSCKEE